MPDPVDIPTVLAVLVVRGGADLRETLAALSAQTYPKIGVLAADAGASQEAKDLLVQALGERRVISVGAGSPVASSVDAVLQIPAAREADHLLILHDDSVLDPDAVARMVAAAQIEGPRPVGVVGAKLVDRGGSRRLVDVGSATDRFGHPYSPLQEGEIDQGQYDRVLEVLFVPSAAMLVGSSCLAKIGGFDERLGPGHEELDLCWRARVCGFRVLMTPLARVTHPSTSGADRTDTRRHKSERYGDERTALASMVKNYRLFSLAWLLPLYAFIGLLRTSLMLVGRRFEDAYDLASAWGWNLAHLPGTVARRWRVQRARAVPDRVVRPFMASAGLRFPHWVETASKIWAEQRELEEEVEDQPIRRRLRYQTTSLLRSHPVFVASFLGAIVAALALRELPGLGIVQGGAMPAFPGSGRLFGELFSGIRTTGLGGPQRASPALAVIGGLSWVAGTTIAQKVLLGASPILAGVFAYRSLVRNCAAVASVVGAAAYALSGLVLWSLSQGRIELLVSMAVLPIVAERITRAFSAEMEGSLARFAVGAGAALAIGVSFYPGIALAAGLLVAPWLVIGPDRWRGLALSIGCALVAAALVFPFAISLVRTGARPVGSLVGPASFSMLARLAPGGGPGTWLTAWFLPAAAALGLSLVRPDARRRAWGQAIAAGGGTMLAWFSAAGYIPGPLSNPLAYLAVAAISEASLVAEGISGVLGVRQEAFGYRQIGAGLLTIVAAGGIALQSMAASAGGWAFGGPEAVTSAWAVLSNGASEQDNVLWIGSADGQPFPSPGGDPQGSIASGGFDVRYSVTDPSGASVLDIGRTLGGSGESYLRSALSEILSGDTVHAGALLAPLGVRYVVAGQGDLTSRVSDLLGSQLDLDRIPEIGLVVFKDTWSPPAVGSIKAPAFRSELGTTALADVAKLPPYGGSPIPSSADGWTGRASGTIYLAKAFNPVLRAEEGGVSVAPVRAFGWATAFPRVRTGIVTIGASNNDLIDAEYLVLAILWLGVLWITRRRT
jgi:GT2 family glycosyltransferase